MAEKRRVLAFPRLEWLRFIADTRNPLGVRLRVAVSKSVCRKRLSAMRAMGFFATWRALTRVVLRADLKGRAFAVRCKHAARTAPPRLPHPH